MTFTFPLINAARNVVMLVTGADKAEAVAALLSDEPAGKALLGGAQLTRADDHLARPGRPGNLQAKQTDWPRPQNGHDVPGLYRHLLHSGIIGNTEGLDEGGLLE